MSNSIQKPPHYISKTSFLAGYQCPKLLWTKLRDREKMPPVDEQTQFIFGQGHEIGELAKSLFPDGIEVCEGEYRYEVVIEETKAQLVKRLPLFEAGITHNGGFARLDILAPEEDGTWQIIEVKSGTSVKDVNVLDVAFQKYLCEGDGLKISKCSLLHVDGKYIRKGEIIAEELLHIEDITNEVDALLPSIRGQLVEQQEILKLPEAPEVKIGPHCTTPYSCDLKPLCWNFLPEQPVTDLYRDTKQLRWEYLDQGITSLTDIPDPSILNAKQKIQYETSLSGEPHIDHKSIRGFLDTLEWPLAYYDIESFMMAIPPYEGTRPYQQIPFQFSLHIQTKPGEALEHHEFLADDLSDPRLRFMEATKELLPDSGSIVAYNASFEKNVLKACAAVLPEYKEWVDSILPRFVDLLVPFRNFSFYHPDQHGSASIKAVLPALTDSSYEGLVIAEGGAASIAFVKMTSEDISNTERDAIRGHLLKYCELDTRAMVDLVDQLQSLTSP